MITQNAEVLENEQKPQVDTIGEVPAKKVFVEPTLSVPADVLEATTFFQTPTIEASTV